MSYLTEPVPCAPPPGHTSKAPSDTAHQSHVSFNNFYQQNPESATLHQNPQTPHQPTAVFNNPNDPHDVINDDPLSSL